MLRFSPVEVFYGIGVLHSGVAAADEDERGLGRRLHGDVNYLVYDKRTS